MVDEEEVLKTEDLDFNDIDCSGENLHTSKNSFEISQNTFDDDIPSKKQRCESCSGLEIAEERSTDILSLLSKNEFQDQEEIAETSVIVRDSTEKNPTVPCNFTRNEKELDTPVFESGTSTKLHCTDYKPFESRAITIPNRGFQLIFNEAKKKRAYSSYDVNW
ncbi:uncharacterized protein NPIL_86371 [Nephila pilipes]|uniref:Uncharacterized protein n=1 Tax=Nephila pilipes TaxID=299642 RepID=A0A8X6NDJ3_NEPPI|nr:uncharacterized protein NPIL_86371 [Nephila pilipes]